MKKLTQEIKELELPKFTGLQTVILMLLVSYATVGALALSAALPAITHTFAVSKHAAQMMISIYMAGFALGNLIYAPLANRHGRKPVMIGCLALAAITSTAGVVASYYHSFHGLILSRLIMALAAGGCLKIGYNIAADVLKGHHLICLTSLFTASFAIAPPLSIALGGFLTEHLGWESVCLFLALYALLLIGLTFFIPETLNQKVLHALHPKHILSTYKETLQGKGIVIGSLLVGCTMSVLYLFGTEAPFISENIIKLTPLQFGLFSLITYAGMLIGGLVGAGCIHRCQPLTLLFVGLIVWILSTLLFLIFFLFSLINPNAFFIPSACIFFGMSLVFSSAVSITLSHAKDKSYGSSLMNCINLSFATLVVIILGRLALIHINIYPITLLTLALLATLLSMIIKTQQER